MNKKISTAELRKKNKNIIYRLFYESFADKTKQDISLELNLSLPTVTQNLNELFEDNLIEYSGFIDSSGGRRARTMKIVSDAKIAIGMEISLKHIRIVATDLYGNEIAYQRINKRFNIDNDINDCLENFLDEFSLDRDKLLGVGITLPAIINNKTGTIENAPVLGIKNIPISQITQGIKYPSYVLNDANAGGYAECFFQKQNKSIAYLFIGKGVGGAIIIDSKAYEGQNLRSAEFGHMCIKPNGNKCACGKLGCLEAYCSTARLCDDLNINIDDFFHELSKGNTEYEKIFDEYLNNLALGINTIRMVLDCDIVIGGSITAEIAEYLDKLKEKVQNLNPFGEECDYISIGSCGTKANCIGSALHFVNTFLNNI